MSIVAANNQGYSIDHSISNSGMDLSLLKRISLEINRNYNKFSELRRSFSMFGQGADEANKMKEQPIESEDSFDVGDE
jgi:hypothetical protein